MTEWLKQEGGRLPAAFRKKPPPSEHVREVGPCVRVRVRVRVRVPGCCGVCFAGVRPGGLLWSLGPCEYTGCTKAWFVLLFG